MTRYALNRIHLNAEVRGAGPPLLLLHGFTGSARTWDDHLPALGSRFTAIALDVIGHGLSDSPPDPERYRMERAVEDVLALLDLLGHERAAALGYSMGGRLALHLALAAPERVTSLVLESASPGIASADEREARIRSDAELADSIERDGVEAFVDRWERNPLFASQDALPRELREELRRQRLRNDVSGLANSLRGMGAGAQRPLHDELSHVQCPTLLLAGELDPKYRALAEEMARGMSNARAVIVPDAGHAVHLERSGEFDRIVAEFLKSQIAE